MPPDNSTSEAKTVTMKTINGSSFDPVKPDTEFVLKWTIESLNLEYSELDALKVFGYDQAALFFGCREVEDTFMETAKRYINLIKSTSSENLRNAAVAFLDTEYHKESIIYQKYEARELFLINLLFKNNLLSQKQRLTNPYYTYFCHSLAIATIFNLARDTEIDDSVAFFTSFTFFLDFLVEKYAKYAPKSEKLDNYIKSVRERTDNDSEEKLALQDAARYKILADLRKLSVFTIQSVDNRTVLNLAEFLHSVFNTAE